jgi:hypothetical protein
MRFYPPRFVAVALLVLVSMGRVLWADPVIPGNILEPKSAPEAWNVIRLATKNVERLLEENRLDEVPVQISYCSPALRALPQMVKPPEAAAGLGAQVQQAFVSVNAIAASAQAKNGIGVKAAYQNLRKLLDDMAKAFAPDVVGADIFFCPMHPTFIDENAKTPCPKCGMDLLTRRIPYSFIYTKPGEPTMHLSITSGGPVIAGKKMEVKVKLEKADKSPVLHDDLMVMHTEPIHLLIEEPALGDYHHEHPVPTETPGEYAFSFTPSKSAPYRIWADLVPAATGVQELPFADLPSEGKAGAIENTADSFASTAGGYQFTLTLRGGNQIPVKAGEMRRMSVEVADAKGQPVTQLVPVMNAFAHLVGFYDDYRTVLHLHPTGGDILNQDLRGGPALGFMLYAPRAGFVRLYCQVLIDGKMLFAPFNLNIVP